MTQTVSVKNSRRSFWWNLISTNRELISGVIIVGSLSAVAILAPVIAPEGNSAINLLSIFRAPSFAHPFGTDELGREVFARTVWGMRVSIGVGMLAALISALVGIAVGSVSGYFGGIIDSILMRFVDIMLSIPYFFLILIIALIFGANELIITLIIGLTIWPNGARLLRGEILKLKNEDFINAAKISGASSTTIMFSELLPIAVFPLVVDSGLRIGSAILIEASLSFLGIGNPNSASLGWLLNDALTTFRSAWWTGVFPGLFLCLIVVGFNLIADGLNSSLNVRMRF